MISVNITPPPPPMGNPPGIWLFRKLLFKFPPTGAKIPFKCPTLGPFRWSNAPTPGTFHRHKNDRRTAETPSVVEQNLYKYNKNWETLLAYLLRTKVSCKAAEIAATRSLNAQLFFVCHATYKAFCKKKFPSIEITTSWPFHWHASSLTLVINIHSAGESNWTLLSFLLNRWYRYSISL